MRSRLATWIGLLLLMMATEAAASDLCSCGAGQTLDWDSVGTTTTGTWSCSGGNGTPDATDHFLVDTGCTVDVTGDILQDGAALQTGIEVAPGGTLTSRSSSAGKRTLALGETGLECFGDCELEGVFRNPAGTAPSLAPESWTVTDVVPCDGDCLATPERGCVEVASATLSGLIELGLASDLETGTEDWLCFWDFDKEDWRASYDDNACYPIVSIDTNAKEVCFDTRQGRDSDYPHRLRRIQELRVESALTAGDGCGVVLDPTDDTRAPSCGGTVVRLDPAPGHADPIQADDELIGRFLRLSDPGQPRDASYKILQTFDCAGSPPAPDVCDGKSADVVVLGSLQGVAAPAAAGSTAWIDYGWRTGRRVLRSDAGPDPERHPPGRRLRGPHRGLDPRSRRPTSPTSGAGSWRPSRRPSCGSARPRSTSGST